MGTYNHPLECVQSRTSARVHLPLPGSFAWVLAESIPLTFLSDSWNRTVRPKRSFGQSGTNFREFT
jgi:hypothetical protein